MRRHTTFVTSFIKNHGTKDLLAKWNSKEVRSEWNKIYVTNPTKKKRRCSSYIMFCIDKREGLKEAHPHYLPSQITSILAKRWRQHKTNNDEIYLYYVELNKKQVFTDNALPILREKYPTLSNEDMDILASKMYEKSKTKNIVTSLK